MKTSLKEFTNLIQSKTSSEVKVINGRKYTKVDVGSSGMFMIDKHGSIFGIKSYGKIHFGHNYGNLNNVNIEKIDKLELKLYIG